MEATIMEVNLCPSSNFGQASCSVLIDSSEESLFSRPEHQAVVRLEHSVTAVCPENGEIQYITVVPDKNIEFNGKVLNKTRLDTGYKVNRFEDQGNSVPTAYKSLLPKPSAGYYDINNKPKAVLPQRDGMATSEKAVQDKHGQSRDRKRKNPDALDTEDDTKKPRKNKQWTQARMQKAIMAVRNGMRVRRAAKVFAVPRTTLKYKLDGKGPLLLDTDLPTSDLSEMINEATKGYSEAKKVERISLPPQAKKMKDKIIPETGQKNSATIKPSEDLCDKNKIKPTSPGALVQHARSLRSNSNILDRKVVVPIEKITEISRKVVLPQKDKSTKEINATDSKQKNTKSNQSPCNMDRKTGNELKPSKRRKRLTHKETKIFKLWSEKSMEKAIRAVKNGSRIRVAAIKFGIPRSTLGRRIASTASFKKTPSLPKSDLQASGSSGTAVGLRQSSRRMKTSEPGTSQTDTEVQQLDDKHLLKREKGSVEKESSINALSEDKPNTTRSRHKANDKSSLSVTGERKSLEKEVAVNVSAVDKTDTAKPRRKLRTMAWTEESMERALEAVDKGMSLCSAAKKFNLPKASLKTRKYKRDNINTRKGGPEPHISSDDEDHIVSYVNDCARFGVVNIKKVGLLLTAEAAEKKLIWDIKKQGLPPDEWWEDFCSRRGSHFMNVDMIQPNQRIKITEARLSLFYDKLLAIQSSSQYHKALNNCSDCQTFTVQEFKYDLDTVSEWVGDSHGEDTCACRKPELDPENKLVSTICCASAAGNSIPPMFIYHTESDYKIPASGLVGPFGAVHVVHDVHDLTRKSDFYFKWFKEVFLKYAPQSRPLILLFDPDTAFITPEFIQLAHKNDIVLLGLPPYSAHIMQPLNRTVFPALKKGFSFTSSLFKRIFVKGVNFNNFARCFKVAWNSSVDAAIIKTGFAEAGIYPINRKVLLKTKKF